MKKKNKYKVKIPNKKGIIFVGDYVYYYTKTFWNAEKKHTDDDRVAIGRIANEERTEMYPNERYGEFFNYEKEEAPSIDSYLKIGPYLVIKRACERIGLYEALDFAFPGNYKDIIALATFAITESSLTAQHYDRFAFSYFSGLSKTLSSSCISGIYRKIQECNKDDFYKKYLEGYKQAFAHTENRKLIAAIDSTNRNTASNTMIDAEYGKSKKDSNNPQVCNAYYVDELTGIPIYQEEFSGSLLDKTQLSYMTKKSNALGFNDIIAVLDRGYYSQSNIDTLKEFDFVLSVPETVGFVKTLFKEHMDIKMQRANYIREHNAYGIKVKIDESINEALSNYYCYLFYDSVRAMEEIDSINNKIERFIEDIESHKYYSLALENKYKKYFTFTKIEQENSKKSLFTFKENTDAIQEAIDKAGMFLVISNIDDSVSRILTLERNRDRTEKCFQRLKSSIDYDAVRVYTNETKEGKDLVAFTSVCIYQALLYFLKPYLNEISSRTLFTTITCLSKIIAYRNKNNQWELRYALSKEQKEILELVDLKENELLKEIKEIFP